MGTNAFNMATLVWTDMGALPFSSIGCLAASASVVMVTDWTNIWTTTDGVSWTPRGNPVTGSIRLVYNPVALVFLVASVTTGNVATSTDGATWTQAGVVLPANAVNTLSCANGVYFFFSGSSTATSYYYSTTGTTWTAVTFNPNGALYAEVSYGAGMYLTISINFNPYMVQGTSPGNMSFLNVGTSNLWTISSWYGSNPFGAGVFLATVAVGGSFYSTSPTGTVPWTTHNSPYGHHSVFFSLDRFFMTSYSDYTVVSLSNDGIFWYPTALPATFSSLGLRVVYLSSLNKFFYGTQNAQMAWMRAS